MNSIMRSWLASGAAAGSGRRVPRIFFPSRLKMRSSIPPASARRASMGHVAAAIRRPVLGDHEDLGGPVGLGDEPADGRRLVVVEARPRVALAQHRAVVPARGADRPGVGKVAAERLAR